MRNRWLIAAGTCFACADVTSSARMVRVHHASELHFNGRYSSWVNARLLGSRHCSTRRRAGGDSFLLYCLVASVRLTESTPVTMVQLGLDAVLQGTPSAVSKTKVLCLIRRNNSRLYRPCLTVIWYSSGAGQYQCQRYQSEVLLTSQELWAALMVLQQAATAS